jgi:hypothetical protein
MKINSFNTDHIKKLSSQVRNISDPDAVRVLVKQHTKQISDITDSIKDEMSKIASKILPILKLPSPWPPSILKWIKKLVLGSALPQLEAHIGFAKDLSKAASAISDITSAIGDLKKVLNEIKNIKSSVLGELNDIIDDTLGGLGDLGGALDDTLKSALGTIDNISLAMNTITGATTTFDTSSIGNFVDTVDSKLDALKASHQAFLDIAAPVVSSAPTIVGDAITGSVLSANVGVWTGDDVSHEYQWYRGDQPIWGATSSEYQLSAADEGSTVTCQVYAENEGGVTPQATAATATVVSNPPTATVDPSISGTAASGSTLTASEGTWEGSPTITYQWQWAHVSANIYGATSSTYTISTEDVGHTLTCIVTATSNGGVTPVRCTPTASVSGNVAITGDVTITGNVSATYATTTEDVYANTDGTVIKLVRHYHANNNTTFPYGYPTSN